MTSALGGGKTQSKARCKCCPPGSETSEDAKALGLCGKYGKTLQEMLGAESERRGARTA